jgi:hypothetical protein
MKFAIACGNKVKTSTKKAEIHNIVELKTLCFLPHRFARQP